MFQFVRDYEAIKVEQEVPNEFLLVIQDEEEIRSLNDVFSDKVQPPMRERGAYYKNIERKMLLKKKRANVGHPFLRYGSLLTYLARLMINTTTNGRSFV